MKIFGFEFKLPRSNKSKYKEILRKEGSLQLKKIMEKEQQINLFYINQEIYNLIREGNFDLDLWRLYKINGINDLKKRLINVYHFNPNQLRIYVAQIKKFDKNRNNKN